MSEWGVLTVTNCTLAGNSASNSNGVDLFSQSVTVTVRTSTLTANTADGTGQGGGIRNTGMLTLVDTIVAGTSPAVT